MLKFQALKLNWVDVKEDRMLIRHEQHLGMEGNGHTDTVENEDHDRRNCPRMHV